MIAVAPADAVSLHWAEIPALDRAGRRRRAPAGGRVSAAPMDELHVAVGEDDAGSRAIGIVNRGAMAGWLARLGEAGVDPVAVVPAPLLLPRPDEGYVRGDLAGQGVVRGRASGFADEPGFTEIVAGEEPLADLDADGIEAALGAAAASPRSTCARVCSRGGAGSSSTGGWCGGLPGWAGHRRCDAGDRFRAAYQIQLRAADDPRRRSSRSRAPPCRVARPWSMPTAS